jgi:hypothetical protein
MKEYSVTIPYPVFVTVKVEAEDNESAIDEAFQYAGLTGYCGNGGSDKLVGVYGSNISVEAGDTPIEGCGFEIEVEETEDK